MAVDFYGELGITADASTAEVRRAFRKIALKHHPDRGRNADTDIFKRALAAHETLSDPVKRRIYDTTVFRHQALRGSFARGAATSPAASAAFAAANSSSATSQTAFHSATFSSYPSSASFAAESSGRATPSTSAPRPERRPPRTRSSVWTSAFEQDRGTQEGETRKESNSRAAKGGDHPQNTPLSGFHSRRMRQSSFRHDTNTGSSHHFARGYGSNSHACAGASNPYADPEPRGHRGPHKFETTIDLTNSSSDEEFEEFEVPPSESYHSNGDQSKSFSGNRTESDGARYQSATSTAFSSTSDSRSRRRTTDTASSSPSDEKVRSDSSPQKRSPNHEGSDSESPTKRRRVFDMSDMRNVPPFTRTNGTSFNFDSISNVMPQPASRSRQYNRRSARHESRQTQRSALQEADHALVQTYLAESMALYNQLIDLHNGRAEMVHQTVDHGLITENIRATCKTLDTLLQGSLRALNELQRYES